MNNLNTEINIIRSRRKTISCMIKNGTVEVRAPLRMSEVQIQEFLKRHWAWIEKVLEKDRKLKEDLEKLPSITFEDITKLAEEAKKVIPQRVSFYAEKIGVTYGRITIRNQKTVWGSCTAKGNLNFNCLLMLTPPEVIDCIVVHELCHRKYMNHSAAFYAEVIKAFPDYRKWEKWLKENGKRLITQMTNDKPPTM